METRIEHINGIIVFYDGDCGFCNKTVTWILKKRKKDIYFCALQSEDAQQIMRKHANTINMDTLYVYENENVYNRYKAVRLICKYLSFPYSLLYYLGQLLPVKIGDYCYNQIAKRRHQIKAKNCSPIPEDRDFFICNTTR